MFKKACLYTAQDPPTTERISDLPGVTDVKVESEPGGRPKTYTVRINGISLKITVMPQDRIGEDLRGFYGYLLHLTDDNPSEHAQFIAAKIHEVRTVLGCVLTPDMDPDGMAKDALFFLNHLQDGLLLAEETVFGPDGDPLIGPLTSRKKS